MGSELGSEADSLISSSPSLTSSSTPSSPGAVVTGTILKIGRLPSAFTEPLSYFFEKAVADLRGSLMFSLTLPARISTTTSDTGRPRMEAISRVMFKMAALSYSAIEPAKSRTITRVVLFKAEPDDARLGTELGLCDCCSDGAAVGVVGFVAVDPAIGCAADVVFCC